MKRTKEQNRGITLIALVITIIVMLILVAVTISMAVNGGLFNYAGNAVGETKNALDVEQQLANGGIEVDGVLYDSIDDYLAGKPTLVTIHSWTRGTGENIDTFTCSHCNTTCTMGQIANYTATGTSKVYADRLGMTVEEEFNEMSVTGEEEIQWVVLGIEDKNKDGVNETLLITSRWPVGVVLEDGSYVQDLPMRGAAAYNNGVSEINRICEELYSNSEYGKARGMTIEDINATLNYTPPVDLTTKLKDLPEASWNAIKSNPNGTYTPDGLNTPEALGEYVVDGYEYYFDKDDTAIFDNLLTVNTITRKEKNIIFGESYTPRSVYWLASRSVWVDPEVAVFGLGMVSMGSATTCCGLLNSTGYDYGEYHASLRPVVSLTSKLPEIWTAVE